MTIISGYEYFKLSKWSYCPHYVINFNPILVDENDIVFLNLEFFSQFVNLLMRFPPKHKFILIAHNSYKSFTIEHFNLLSLYVNHIYAINCIVKHTNITNIPMGFIDDKYKPHSTFYTLLNKNIFKDILLYSNFNVELNKIKRIECLNSFIGKNWVTKEQHIPLELFYKKIQRSKFALSPEGVGIDNPFIYEAIFFNTIPIVKTSQMDDFYKNLPILIVDEWNYVTKDFLENNYHDYFNTLIEWKKNNPNWTKAIYWIQSKN